MAALLLALALQDPVEVDAQPLGANALRVLEALDFLGSPLPAADAVRAAVEAKDAKRLQQALDPHALLLVHLNPESRVKVSRGKAEAVLMQGAFTPFLVKVLNDATVKSELRISSPQAGNRSSGGANGRASGDPARFLQVEMHQAPPMTGELSGLKAEYAIALVYSLESGKREATFSFDVGQGTQDLGFRAEVPVLFDVRPGIRVKLSILDSDGKPTAGRFTFRDKAGRVHPPRPKRLAPDFFFQDQVYRHHGGSVLLPSGELTMQYGRGPEYRLLERKVVVPAAGEAAIEVRLERWVNPMTAGWYSGDHHIHAAGCAHYTNPSEGVHAPDMFVHVKGEGLNVGCNLTWGPCYEYQRQFFLPTTDPLSEPLTLLKYDVEVSGFGSQAMGHVCLLNLKDQTFPGSEGTKTKGWPTWTTPLMQWAKAQGAVTGYAHSASGLGIRWNKAARRILAAGDRDKDGKLSRDEAAATLMPEPFADADADRDGVLGAAELEASAQRAAVQLPNTVVPEMDGIGAQEICVTVAKGVCDFISAMDTQRIPEWNCWYHLMNCGYPLKASGETDFPCISGSRVGEGRVYVQLGRKEKLDYAEWCEGLRKGASYISDGYAHALEFGVGGKVPGDELALAEAGTVKVRARVAFASSIPLGTARGGIVPKDAKTKLVELVVNGQAVASKEVPADDREHVLDFDLKADRSGWVALRHFPQLHTNPVNVIVGGKPIRASRKSALWAVGVIEQLWRVRGEPPDGRSAISDAERPEAKKAFEWALEQYRRIAAECPEGS
jgi:hypothetical protein